MFEPINLFNLFSLQKSEIQKANDLSIMHYNSKGFQIKTCKDLSLDSLKNKPHSSKDTKIYENHILDGKSFRYITYPPLECSENYFNSAVDDQFLNISDLEKVILKIEKGMDTFKRYKPEIYHFIVSQVGYVQLWNRPSIGPSSANTGDYDSRILLFNIDAEEVSVFKIMEMLLHESIHCFLNVYELYFPFSFREVNHQELVFSKWTKNKIGAYSILHACFVWFGLYHLAEKMKKNPEISKVEIRELQFVSSRGFILPGDILDSIKTFHPVINQYVFKEIEAIQSWFRKIYISELKTIRGETFEQSLADDELFHP